MVQTPYEAPSKKAAALIGKKMRSGLKIVMTLSRIMKNPRPSDAIRILEVPMRRAASIGSKRTLYPAFKKANVVVVGVENPFGRRCRNSRRYSLRAARKPEVRSGM